MSDSLLHETLFFLLAALLIVPIFKRLGLGSVLGYLAAGLLIGPSVLGLIGDVDNVLHFAEIGVIMMLFVVGLELDPTRLWQMRKLILGMGTAQLLLTGAALAGFAYWLGHPQATAIFVGLTLALSSTAFAMQLMSESNEMTTRHGHSAIAILLFQDIAVIPLLLILPLLAGVVDTSNGIDWLKGVWTALTLVGLVLASRYLINPWLRWLADTHYRELMSASALLLVLGVAVLMEAIGLSMGLGAFLAGILLANSPFRHQLETDIEPFKGLLLGLFFIAIGMSLQISLLLDDPLLIFLWVIVLVAVKALVLILLGFIQRLKGREALTLGILLSQGGEFAFVLLTQARALNVIDDLMVDQMTLIVGMSMITTPLLMKLIRPKPVADTSTDAKPVDMSGAPEEPNVIIAGFGRFGQIVGRILAVKGIPFTALDRSASYVEFITRYGNKVYYGDASRLDVLQQARVGKASLVVLALGDVDQSLKAAHLLREHFPHVRIIARAVTRHHAMSLMALGIPVVLRETFESSLLAAKVTLTELGMTESAALDTIKMFRDHDERLLREQVDFREDLEKIMEIASKGREEFMKIFAQDRENPK